MGVMNHLLMAWWCDGTQNVACLLGFHLWVSRSKKGIQMTESTHLLKPYAMQVEVSKDNWRTMQHLVQDNLEKELRRHCAQQGLSIHSINHLHRESVHISEDGVMYETIIAACTALLYQLNESADQSVRKINIDDAQREWFEDD